MKKHKFNSPVWIPVFALIHFLVFFGTLFLGWETSSVSIQRVLGVICSTLCQPLVHQVTRNGTDLSGFSILMIFLMNSIIWAVVIWLIIKLIYKKNRILNWISLISLLLFFLTFSTVILLRNTIPSSIQASPKKEITFINVFLESCFGEAVSNGTPLVIDETLSLQGITFSSDIDDLKKDLIRSQTQRKLKEAIRDLFRKNTSDCEFSIIGGPSLSHVLIPTSECFGTSRSEGKDGWAMFYEKYPDSPGIIQLSRVGFSRDGSVAIVYMGNQRGWLAGSGRLRAYIKNNGHWEIMPYFNPGPHWVS